MQNRQQKDLAMWQDWKKTNNTQTLNGLVDRLNPLVQKEVNKWSATVPRVALEAKAKVLTVDAIKTYNPNKGAAVGTHVASRLRKLSRFVYPYQNVARLPENKQLKYNTFAVAKGKLYDNLGRDPTVPELSQELSWTQKTVRDFETAFDRKEYVESEGAFMDDDSDRDGLVDFYYHGLDPTNQRLFEDITGYAAKPVLPNSRLMGKHKLTQGQLSYRKRKFINDIKDIQSGKF